MSQSGFIGSEEDATTGVLCPGWRGSKTVCPILHRPYPQPEDPKGLREGHHRICHPVRDARSRRTATGVVHPCRRTYRRPPATASLAIREGPPARERQQAA
jgi:hypothetical protein